MKEEVEQMQIILNGEERTIADNTPLPELLKQVDVDPEDARGIAVAVNDRVVRRQEWENATLHDGDRVEVVTATQGG